MKRPLTLAELELAIKAQGEKVIALQSELAGIGAPHARNGASTALEARRTKLLGARAKLRALEAQRELERAVEQINRDPRVVSARWCHRWRMLRAHHAAVATIAPELRQLLVELTDGSLHHLVVPSEVTGEELIAAFAGARQWD